LNRQSLGTKDLKEARRKIRELETLGLTTLAEALAAYDRGVIVLSKGAKSL
jgi:Mg-chelatase subunit ChlD